MAERSRYQEKVIRNYYQNRDSIALQRIQELLSDLYLAEGKKRESVWKSLATHLEKAGLPAAEVAHLREQDKPELVANVIKRLMEKS
ncbi:MAG: hypothetical protein R3B96_07070 [Pirellulaceae bacterium]|nr:hypothetical protein [Planctomycetales bacterium]